MGTLTLHNHSHQERVRAASLSWKQRLLAGGIQSVWSPGIPLGCFTASTHTHSTAVQGRHPERSSLTPQAVGSHWTRLVQSILQPVPAVSQECWRNGVRGKWMVLTVVSHHLSQGPVAQPHSALWWKSCSKSRGTVVWEQPQKGKTKHLCLLTWGEWMKRFDLESCSVPEPGNSYLSALTNHTQQVWPIQQVFTIACLTSKKFNEF